MTLFPPPTPTPLPDQLGIDTDGDGIPDDEDSFPNDPKRSIDTDSDGFDDLFDNDDDNDGVIDINDAFPLDPANSADDDHDGIGNNNDETPYLVGGLINLDTSSYRIDENAGTMTLTINRTDFQDSSPSVNILFCTTDKTAIANIDYVPHTGSLVFNTTEASKQVTIKIIDNDIFSGNKQFEFHLLSSKFTNLGELSTAQIDIMEDEPIPAAGLIQWSTDQTSETETDKTIAVKVKRLGSTASEVSVSFATQDGSATAGLDYQAQSGVLTFHEGETEKTIPLTLQDDTTRERDENFVIALSHPTNEALLSLAPTMNITIVDNDEDNAISEIGFDDHLFNIIETKGQLGVNVIRASNSDIAASVEWTTRIGSAKPNTEFATANGILNYAPGETVKFINLALFDDETYEANESFSLHLKNPSDGSVIINATKLITIIDNDPPKENGAISLSGTRYVAKENAASAFVTVNRNFTKPYDATIEYATLTDTAQEGIDFNPITDHLTFVGSNLTFSQGETSKTIAIDLLDNDYYQGNKSFIFRLSNPSSNVSLGKISEAIIQIIDDEPTPIPGEIKFSGSEYTVNPGDTKAIITLQRMHGFVGEISVAYRTVNSTAKADEQFVTSSGVIVFADSEQSKTIEIDILDTNKLLIDTSFKLILSEPSGTQIEGIASTIINIIGTKSLPPPLVEEENTNNAKTKIASLSFWMLLVTSAFFLLLAPRTGSKG